MRSFFNAVFTAPWTAAITVAYISLARITGDLKHAQRGERVWAKGLLRTWGVPVSVFGAERLVAPGPYLIMANHQSHVDIPVLFASLPVTPGFLAKQELDKIPFLSMALRGAGHVLIDRSNRESARQLIKSVGQQIAAGATIAIFPEGTRGDGAQLGEFKRGTFLIAKAAGVPLIPVGIRGTHAVLPRDALCPRPGKVEVHVGEAILPETVKRTSAEALGELVEQRIAALSALAPAQLANARAGGNSA